MQSLTDCTNSTGAVLTSANFSVTEGTADGGVVTLASGAGDFSGDTANCTTTYLATTLEQRNADSFVVGLAVFGSFAGVIVLALVGMVIIGLFKRKD